MICKQGSWSVPLFEVVYAFAGRMKVLQPGKSGNKNGPVVYWMSRDHRSRDNWALLHAVSQAQTKGVPVAVVFNLVDKFLDAKARHFGFMLRGLQVVEQNLKAVGIPFFIFRGKAEDTVPSFIERCNASLLVMDYSSLRIGRQWRKAVCQKVDSVVEVMEVDAHNVVPIWCASDKLEYGARTIRTKIQRQLSEFLTEYPILESSGKAWDSEPPPCIQWDSLIADVLRYVSSTRLYILHCVRKKECLQFGQNQEMRG
jgi:deoxyribodipyrimidine photo-lyase